MKCKWYAEFEGICVNGDCPYRGDTCPTSEYPEVCKYAEEKKPKPKPELNAEELAAERDAQKPEWINVKDRLPEAGKILVTDGETVTISNGAWLYRSPEGKIRVPANYGAGLTVTHWMPRPKPPKEERER